MLYLSLLILVAVQRLVELAVSRRNAAWALTQGGKEFGRGHFGWMKLLHTAFLLGCAFEVLFLARPFLPALGYPMIAFFLLAQLLRYGAIFALGRQWNVRVIIVPGAPVVSSGPYRYLRHPNYLAVIGEGLSLPLIHSAWITAVAFSLLNAFLLRERIRCEEEALRKNSDYSERVGDRPRFVPLSVRPH